MKKIIYYAVSILVIVVAFVVATSGSSFIFDDKQRGSRITIDDHTPFELVTKQQGDFVEVESGMVYSIPRLWRDKIDDLEGKKVAIMGTRHLTLENRPIYINGEKVISQNVTNKGMAIRLVTNYDSYTYRGTILVVDCDTHLEVHRIYWPHRYV